MALSPRQIYAVARDAGFPTGTAVTMTAIALAESGGDPNAHNTSGEDSRGLWQINVAANTDLRGMNLFDPRTNAKAAKIIYDRQGLRAWSVFKSGAYQQHMGAAMQASSQTEGTSIGDVLRSLPVAARTLAGIAPDIAGAAVGQLPGADVAGSVGQAVGLAAKAGTWLSNPQNWVRIVYVWVGGMLVIGALVMLAAPTLLNVAGGPTAKIAKRVIK